MVCSVSPVHGLPSPPITKTDTAATPLLSKQEILIQALKDKLEEQDEKIRRLSVLLNLMAPPLDEVSEMNKRIKATLAGRIAIDPAESAYFLSKASLIFIAAIQSEPIVTHTYNGGNILVPSEFLKEDSSILPLTVTILTNHAQIVNFLNQLNEWRKELLSQFEENTELMEKLNQARKCIETSGSTMPAS